MVSGMRTGRGSGSRVSSGGGGGGAVDSVNGQTGVVSLDAGDIPGVLAQASNLSDVSSIPQAVANLLEPQSETTWLADTNVYPAGYVMRVTPSGKTKTADGIRTFAELDYDAVPDLELPRVLHVALSDDDQILVSRDGVIGGVPRSQVPAVADYALASSGGNRRMQQLLGVTGTTLIDLRDGDPAVTTAGNWAPAFIGSIPGRATSFRVDVTPGSNGHTTTWQAGTKFATAMPTTWVAGQTESFACYQGAFDTQLTVAWINEPAQSIPIPIDIIGTWTVGTLPNVSWRNDTGFSVELVAMRVQDAATAPTGSSAVFDLLINGTTAWGTNAGNKPTVLAGATGGVTTLFDTSIVPVDATVTWQIDAVGSTVAGAGGTIVMTVRRARATTVATPLLTSIDHVYYSAADRSNATPLAGVTLAGTVFIGTTSVNDDIDQIDWFINHPNPAALPARGSATQADQAYVRSDSVPRFDLFGGAESANGWNTTLDPAGKWNDVSNGRSLFATDGTRTLTTRVWRKSDGGSFVQTTTFSTDNDLVVAPPAAPAWAGTPTSTPSNNTVVLDWNAVASAVEYEYRVEANKVSPNPPTTVGVSVGTATGVTLSSLDGGVSHAFQTRCRVGSLWSDWSTTQYAVPTGTPLEMRTRVFWDYSAGKHVQNTTTSHTRIVGKQVVIPYHVAAANMYKERPDPNEGLGQFAMEQRGDGLARYNQALAGTGVSGTPSYLRLGTVRSSTPGLGGPGPTVMITLTSVWTYSTTAAANGHNAKRTGDGLSSNNYKSILANAQTVRGDYDAGWLAFADDCKVLIDGGETVVVRIGSENNGPWWPFYSGIDPSFYTHLPFRNALAGQSDAIWGAEAGALLRNLAVNSVTLATSAAADDIIDTATAHGFVAGDVVRFTGLTGGAGLTSNTAYYVVATSLGSTTFRVAATPGGTPINFSTDITAGTVAKAGQRGDRGPMFAAVFNRIARLLHSRDNRIIVALHFADPGAEPPDEEPNPLDDLTRDINFAGIVPFIDQEHVDVVGGDVYCRNNAAPKTAGGLTNSNNPADYVNFTGLNGFLASMEYLQSVIPKPFIFPEIGFGFKVAAGSGGTGTADACNAVYFDRMFHPTTGWMNDKKVALLQWFMRSDNVGKNLRYKPAATDTVTWPRLAATYPGTDTPALFVPVP